MTLKLKKKTNSYKHMSTYINSHSQINIHIVSLECKQAKSLFTKFTGDIKNVLKSFLNLFYMIYHDK